LVSSEFIPTATFGMLVAATLAAGTIINLTLLPALVSWVDTR
jgi:predicted RND superfamily exporter protein